MATIGTIITKLKADTGGYEKGMRRAGRSTKAFHKTASRLKALLITGLGFYAMMRTMRKAVTLFGRQEMAEKKVAAGLRVIGKHSVGAVKDLKQFASEIQALTLHGDEAVLELMAMGATMGKLSGRDLKRATRAAIGLSEAYGIELVGAMRLVARASVGDTATLKRYGITLDATLTPQQKFNELLKIGAANFALAEKAAETMTGRIQQAKNAWGDYLESLGKAGLRVGLDILTPTINIEKHFAQQQRQTKEIQRLRERGFKYRELGEARAALPGLRRGADQAKLAEGLRTIIRLTEELEVGTRGWGAERYRAAQAELKIVDKRLAALQASAEWEKKWAAERAVIDAQIKKENEQLQRTFDYLADLGRRVRNFGRPMELVQLERMGATPAQMKEAAGYLRQLAALEARARGPEKEPAPQMLTHRYRSPAAQEVGAGFRGYAAAFRNANPVVEFQQKLVKLNEQQLAEQRQIKQNTKTKIKVTNWN
jgi:hypothetical protein